MTDATPRISIRAKRRRSLMKTVTWRAAATIDTFLISYFITGNWIWAGSIVGIEVMTKMFLYYLHERAWARVPWGIGEFMPGNGDSNPERDVRSS